MSKRSLHASDAGDDACVPQPKRPNIGSSSPPYSDFGALTDSLDLFSGPDFSSDLPNGLQLDLPNSLHLGLPSLSLPLDAQPSPPQSIALSPDHSSTISPSALLDDIKRLVADNLTRLILQHHSSDLGRLLPCLPIGQSFDRPGSPSNFQPSGTRSRTSPPCHDISHGTHVDDDAAVESWSSKPHEWLPPSTPSMAHSSVYRDNFATPSPSTGHAEAQPLSHTPTPLPPYQGLGPGVGPRTSSKSTSICWWDRFRQVPLHRLHVTAAQVDELHQTTLSALHALRNHPSVFGTTASQNSFGHLIRAAWEPSTTVSVMQIAICMILYIALPPEQTASTDLPKHALHRDERPATWGPQSRKLHSLWKDGSATKMRSIDYGFLYAKYSTYVPEVHEKDFDKRMRDLVKYGGCYVFIAWQLGLGSLVALRSLIEPHSKHMWGCTKGSTSIGSLTSQTCSQVIAYLTSHGIPRVAHQSGADRLMHQVLWQIGGMFPGFERSSKDAPFPGFEHRME